MSIDNVVAMFSKQKGRSLVGVWTQQTSATLPPDTQDRPIYQAETRIVLDFKDEASGRVQSVFIRVTQDDTGSNVLGFGEFE